MTTLTSLIERVEAGEVTFALERDLFRLFDPEASAAIPPRYCTSIDAVVALIEQANTKFDWSLFFDNEEALAGCQPASEDGCDLTDTPGATPALALLLAFLRAMEAEAA